MPVGDGRPEKTSALLSKFERAGLIGERCIQLERGAPTTLSRDEIPEGGDTHAIAEKEVLLCKLPLRLKRTLPDGETEDVDPNLLEFDTFY